MSRQARLEALRQCLAEYQRASQAVNDRLAAGAGAERDELGRRKHLLGRKIEQAKIEIGFLENVDRLIADYTKRQEAAYAEAAAARGPDDRGAFEAYARFCETVVDDALREKQTVPDIDEASLNGILADLRRAAQEAKDTVTSINRALELANRALDGLIMLARVAAKFAV